MKELIDAVVTAALTLTVATGSTYALKKIGTEVKRAALTKAAQGLPPLAPFTRKLTTGR